MITWRNGKGGFLGGSKHFMRGVFQYSHNIRLNPINPVGYLQAELTIFSAYKATTKIEEV